MFPFLTITSGIKKITVTDGRSTGTNPFLGSSPNSEVTTDEIPKMVGSYLVANYPGSSWARGLVHPSFLVE